MLSNAKYKLAIIGFIAGLILFVLLLQWGMEGLYRAKSPDGMEYHRYPVTGRECVLIRTGGYYCDAE